METFDSIKEKGLLIYRYIRGSHAYGLEKPDGTSDVDEGAIYIAPIEETLGMPSFSKHKLPMNVMIPCGMKSANGLRCC